MPQLRTPYYLIDEAGLKKNLEIIRLIREESGAKSVLALKCFSTWCVFDLMRQYMDGTTSSSLFEARLGREKFGKEVHAYSVAYSAEEVEAVSEFADKVIFNSISQLKMFHDRVSGLKVGFGSIRASVIPILIWRTRRADIRGWGYAANMNSMPWPI